METKKVIQASLYKSQLISALVVAFMGALFLTFCIYLLVAFVVYLFGASADWPADLAVLVILFSCCFLVFRYQWRHVRAFNFWHLDGQTLSRGLKDPQVLSLSEIKQVRIGVPGSEYLAKYGRFRRKVMLALAETTIALEDKEGRWLLLRVREMRNGPALMMALMQQLPSHLILKGLPDETEQMVWRALKLNFFCRRSGDQLIFY